MIPDSLATQPIFLCVDDTMVAKAGTRFENVSKLFDHAAHNGSNYLNGHCFVSIMLCIPVWKNDRMNYIILGIAEFMLVGVLAAGAFVLALESEVRNWQC